MLLAYIIYTIQFDRKQGIQYNNCPFKVYNKEKALIIIIIIFIPDLYSALFM